MSSECLLRHFSTYGEIEEGPFRFDKHTGKSKGFAFFGYKTEERAKAAVLHPRKNIDGHQIVCKYAGEGKKGNHGAAPNVGVGGIQTSIGFPGNDALQPVEGGVAVLPHHQHPFSIGGPALTPIGSRAPPSLGSGGAYVGGTGGAYGVGSQYGGPRSGESSQHRYIGHWCGWDGKPWHQL
ncbi:hypothetical protein VitviT2T_015195 [Vitis vinifera]|uniref:RRM domain-containing protein n=1 Tax=Vitis vinifera TaxID=29760 RepID=A0ABY9CR24_VITVI|nr:hypothetical protein VitviT2T_015195 [Vitis vinifera]